jgi:putative flippase GtrA
MRLAIVYTIIALIATAANLGAQELTVRAWHGAFQIELSVFIGTGVGLVVKYALDKIFIFRFRAASTLHDLHTFIL